MLFVMSGIPVSDEPLASVVSERFDGAHSFELLSWSLCYNSIPDYLAGWLVPLIRRNVLILNALC